MTPADSPPTAPRRALWPRLLAVVAALPLLGVGLLYALRDQLHPPPPPPLELTTSDPKAPDVAGGTAPLPLRAAGIALNLPKGTRCHPNSVRRHSGWAQLRARLHQVIFSVSFYGEGSASLGERYRSALEGDVPEELASLLFGKGELIQRRTLARPGGEVYVFELRTEGGRQRDTVLVARPGDGPGLATITARYPFDPAANRAVLAIADTVAFPGPPES